MNTFCTIAPTKKLCAKEHMSWSLNNTSVSCERVRSVGRGSSTRFIAVRAVLVWRLSRRQNNYQLVSPARLAVTQRGVSHALTTLPRCLYFLFYPPSTPSPVPVPHHSPCEQLPTAASLLGVVSAWCRCRRKLDVNFRTDNRFTRPIMYSSFFQIKNDVKRISK